MLKAMISFIAATLLAAILSPFGLWGMLIGSLAGSVIGWWAAKRFMPQ